MKLLQRLKESLREQLSVSKMILKEKWDYGAKQAELLKEKQRKVLKKKEEKNESKK